MNRRKILFAMLGLTMAWPACFASDHDKVTPAISGKVINTQKKPLSGAQIILRDQEGRQLSSQVTDDRGEFECRHDPCESCTLEVLPDHESRFACAFIEGIPGDTNRNFIVPLQHGFLVSGRVMHQDRGFKGVNIKVIPLAEEESPHKVHEGGWAKTARNGGFSMVLTPGRKKLVLLNEKFKEIGVRYHKEFDVTGDMTLPDVVLD